MQWIIGLAVIVVLLTTFILLTEGRYFGKFLVKWVYDRFGGGMFPNSGYEALWSRLIDAIGLEGDAALLDVGTCSGGLPLRLAARRDFTGRAVGVDWSEALVQQAREAAERRGLSELTTFMVADAREPFPFEAETFDAVVCLGVLEGLPGPERSLAELVRVTKPGGVLAVSLYPHHPITPSLSLEWYAERLKGYAVERLHLRRTHDVALFTKPIDTGCR